MDRLRDPRPELRDIAPYDARHVRAEVVLSANENPQDLPGELIDKIAERLRRLEFNRYPDPLANELREMIAEANGLESKNVLVGNGGDELILDLLLAWGGAGRTLLDMPPTFAMYGIDAQMLGMRVLDVPRRKDFSVDADATLQVLAGGEVDMVVVSHPNNPTGNLSPETVLIDILNATDALVLVDEAYFEYSRHTMRPHMERHPNLVILRTFSKAFSMAGLRVGYLLAHEDVVSELTKVRQPYSVNRFSQMVAAMVFRERAAFEAGISETLRNRDVLLHGLSSLQGVQVFPSEANFVLFRVEHGASLWRDLLHGHSVLVRDFSRTPGLADCLRVTVGAEEENRRFLEAVASVLGDRRASEIIGGANVIRGRD